MANSSPLSYPGSEFKLDTVGRRELTDGYQQCGITQRGPLAHSTSKYSQRRECVDEETRVLDTSSDSSQVSPQTACETSLRWGKQHTVCSTCVRPIVRKEDLLTLCSTKLPQN